MIGGFHFDTNKSRTIENPSKKTSRNWINPQLSMKMGSDPTKIACVNNQRPILQK